MKRATTFRDDPITRRIAVRPYRTYYKKINATFFSAGRSENHVTVIRRLSKKFGFSSRIISAGNPNCPPLKCQYLLRENSAIGFCNICSRMYLRSMFLQNLLEKSKKECFVRKYWYSKRRPFGSPGSGLN